MAIFYRSVFLPVSIFKHPLKATSAARSKAVSLLSLIRDVLLRPLGLDVWSWSGGYKTFFMLN